MTELLELAKQISGTECHGCGCEVEITRIVHVDGKVIGFTCACRTVTYKGLAVGVQ